ncbi:MAG: phosphopentomutase [Firmicutes bacterium]|nr:phosphopentomutase [Bacillota bacterium]
MKKVILMVTDSMGVGALPDGEQYGDLGTDTLGHILERKPDLEIPNLRALGIGNIDGVSWGNLAVKEPVGCFGKMAELSKGKDTTTGHWELAGLRTQVPFKTYPDGFPAEFMEAFEREIGIGCLGNYPASGTEIIEVLGPDHEATGKPIVYTSADSVFQIAVNIDVVPLERLYEICKIARRLLVGDWACGRVIARPYVIKDGKRERTPDRRDYAVTPPADTVLDAVSQGGKVMYGVGKIGDIFNQKGLTHSVHTVSNMDGVDKTIEAMRMDFEGFVFTNLVDFDSKYGHRRDPEGYGRCIEEFDRRLPEIMEAMGEEDLLMIVADHGNDPTHIGTDHTREYVPILVYGKNCRSGVNLGVRESFADAGATVADILGVRMPAIGTSFKEAILK